MAPLSTFGTIFEGITGLTDSLTAVLGGVSAKTEAQLDVLAHGHPEQHGVLGNHADGTTQALLGDLVDRMIADPDLAGGGFVKPEYQPGQGRFTGAGWPNHRHLLAGLDLLEVIDRKSGFVGHAVQGDLLLEAHLFDLLADRLEFAFAHTNAYGENYFSFVNGQYTNDGGTHQSAFREGILKGVNEFAKNGFAGEDVRDGIIGAVAGFYGGMADWMCSRLIEVMMCFPAFFLIRVDEGVFEERQTSVWGALVENVAATGSVE